MANTLMFVCSDEERCMLFSAPFREAGWDIRIATPDSAETLATIEAAAPVATVFDLETGHVDAVRSLSAALMADPNVARPLIVFVGGDDELVTGIKADVPFGVFVQPDELDWVLKHLIYKG